ncbi:MAG: hypothetical protein U9Q75_07730 [Pseudomonadota bacterium]|nr:hypothetical protein [Pseudomonadota bacterium]
MTINRGCADHSQIGGIAIKQSAEAGGSEAGEYADRSGLQHVQSGLHRRA